MGWAVRGNRWKVNGPGADPPDALGLDIWAWGLAQGVDFQRYIISFEEQHHSGQRPLHPSTSHLPLHHTHPHSLPPNNPPQASICPVIDETPSQHIHAQIHKQKNSLYFLISFVLSFLLSFFLSSFLCFSLFLSPCRSAVRVQTGLCVFLSFYFSGNNICLISSIW